LIFTFTWSCLDNPIIELLSLLFRLLALLPGLEQLPLQPLARLLQPQPLLRAGSDVRPEKTMQLTS
jgi:hypothetical protein